MASRVAAIRCRRALLAAILALAAGLGGCQTIGETYDKMFGSSRPAEKPADLQPVTSSRSAKLRWQVAVGSADQHVFVPGVHAQKVYAASAAGQIVRVDIATGQVEWRADAQSRLAGGVGGDDAMALVGTPKGEVLAFGAAGKLLWRAQLTSEVLAAPQVSGDTVVARSVDGRVYGLDARDGRRRWLYQRATPSLAVRSHAGVVLSRGTAYVGYAGGKLVALTLSGGALRWEGTVAQPRGTTELERIADVTSLPVVDGSKACAVAIQGRLVCFDISNGAQAWARDLSSVVGIGHDARAVYATDDRNAVHAFDKGSGANLWKQDRLTGRQVSAPAAFGDVVAVGDFQGYVHFLSRSDGSFVARAQTDGSPVLAQPVVVGETLIVQTRAGGVFAFSSP